MKTNLRIIIILNLFFIHVQAQDVLHENEKKNLTQFKPDKPLILNDTTYNISSDWIGVNTFPDMSDYSLGSTFKGNDLKIFFKNPLILDYSIDTTTTGSGDNFQAYLVTSSKGLRKALQIDAKVEVSYFNFSGDASLSFYKNFELNTNSLALIIEYRRTDRTLELIPKHLNKNGLVKDAKKLIEKKKYSEFFKKYGDHYVKKIDQGYLLYTILRIDNISESNYQSIQNQFSFDYDGLASISADVNVKQVLDQNFKESKVSISILSSGTNQKLRDNISSILQGIYDANKSSEDLLKKISEIYKNSLSNKPYNLKFWASSLTDFDWQHPENYYKIPDRTYLRLQRLIDNYATSRRKIFEIEEIYRNKSTISRRLRKSQREFLYNNTRINWQDYIEDLSDRFDLCKNQIKCDTCCSVPLIPIGENYELPKMYAIQITPDNYYIAGNLGDNQPIAVAYQSALTYGLPSWHVYVMASYANILVDPNIEYITNNKTEMLRILSQVKEILRRAGWTEFELNNVQLIDLGDLYPNLNFAPRILGRDWIKFHYYCVD